MPNIKSAKKRVRVNSLKQLQNKMVGSAMKTNVKKVKSAVLEGDREKATATFPLAVKSIEKAVSRHIIHRNKGSRKVSQLQKSINAMNA
ncbi:30S ribosomal protein S20 [Oscillospiraceae bacterium OttesenSCG-928-G22]|nr:30S ribosomal protein S20 [Oscillospiraceae bacterium OttesenSCG-928-G22]